MLLVYAVLYLHTVTTRNKTIGVHVMDLGSGKDQRTNEKKTRTRFGLLPIEVGMARCAQNVTMKQRGEFHQNNNNKNKQREGGEQVGLRVGQK